MIRITAVLAALGILIGAAAADAQQPWAVELRVGADVPTQNLGDADLGTGIGLDGTVRYSFLPHLAVYAGWDWIHFNPDNGFAAADLDVEETGYVFGLRFEHPFSGEVAAGAGPSWWVRAGGTYSHLEIEDAEGEIVADSDHGLGFEAGAGLAFDIGGRWSLTPGARYHSLSRELELEAGTADVDLQYIALEIGLAWRF